MIDNAIITSADLVEEHGCITLEMSVEGEGWGVTLGGYRSGQYLEELILKIFDTLEVYKVSQLPGKIIRVEHEWGDTVHIFGHPYKDKWLIMTNF